MSKHTKGPWRIDGEIDARYLVGIGGVLLVRRDTPNDNRYVAMVSFDAMGHGSDVRTDSAERYANCRLIAAAPDLLEALKGAHETMFRARSMLPPSDGGHQELGAAMEMARAAIARATEG